MPTYHYRCSECEHSFDIFQKFAEDPLTSCPKCGGPIHRVPQPVGIVFKGSGWYVTDSRNAKHSTSSATTDTAEKKNGTDQPAAKESESKTPAAAATKES